MYLLTGTLSLKPDAPSETEVLLDDLGKTRGEMQMFPVINASGELRVRNSLMYFLHSSVILSLPTSG